MNLVRVRRAKGLPFAPATLYKWHHTRKYPELFIKVGGSLFWTSTDLKESLRRGGDVAARAINNLTPELTGAPVAAQGRGAAGGGWAWWEGTLRKSPRS